jgi:peptidylprolyl isomerase
VPTEKRQRQKEGQQARKEAALAAAKKRQRKRQLTMLAVVAVVLLALIAVTQLFGKDDDKKDVASGDTKKTTTTTAASSTPTSAKPDAPAAGGATPVTKLEVKDLKVGTGATVKAGDTIVAHYLGATYKDGKVFQASWDSGSTFETVIGEGKVIKGWDDGIPGMKVGGRRQLTIPAADAYGAEDTGDGRPHGDLVFIIDVYAVK